LQYIFLSEEIDLMQEGIDEPDIGDEEINKFNLANFWFNIDYIIKFHLPYNPLLLESI
jgi:hypothetical protein